MGPTHGSNVISPMPLITILGGLTSGSNCMFEMLFNVYCASGSGMMIQINGVSALIGRFTSMELIDYMDMS
jgi:hypothetical protein